MAFDGEFSSSEEHVPEVEGQDIEVEKERRGLSSVIHECLSQAEVESLKKKYKDFFEASYENSKELTRELQDDDSFSFTPADEVYIAESVGLKSATDERGCFASRYSQAVEVYLYELFNFVKAKSKIIENSDSLSEFVHYIDALHFSRSPNISEAISAGKRFHLATYANRIPALGKIVVDAFVGEVVYRLNFDYTGGVSDQIIREISNMSTSRKLDALYLCEKIISQYLYEELGEGFPRLYMYIAKEIMENGYNAFLQYAAERVISSMEGYSYSQKPEKTSIASDYTGRFDRHGILEAIAKTDDGQKLHYQDCEEVVKEVSLNPFQSLDSEELAMILRHLHRPDMKELVERDLGLNLNEITLATQVQLLQFMAEEPQETFEKLRAVLPGEGPKRQHLLTAFLACAKDRNYGYKILDLAQKHPDEASAIFERFYQIISITRQEEEKFKEALEASPDLSQKTNLIQLYRTTIGRGAELLNDAHENINKIEDIEAYLLEAKRYQLKLIAFRGIFDSITAGDRSVSPEEIEQLSADRIKVEIKKGGEMNLSETDKQMVINNIRKTYKGIDEGWAESLIEELPVNFSNPSANFILIRNDEGALVAIGRADKVSEKEYHMGTFYVEDGYQGVGRYIGQYLEQDISKDALIKGVTAPGNLATMWHIEINGYVGSKIVHQGKSKALIECDNHPGITFKTQDKKTYPQAKIIDMGEGDFEGGEIKIMHTNSSSTNDNFYEGELDQLFNLGYRLTRFFHEDKKKEAANTWMVFEKVS